MTLADVKKALKTKPLFVWVVWTGARDEGDYVPMSKPKFLAAIGADVPFSAGGLHDSTAIAAAVRDDGVYIN